MNERVRLPAVSAAIAVLSLIASAPASAQAQPERAMIVLDASGSMWGQIDGAAKIAIARRVLADVLAASPGDLELGLMAYGHREKGKCDDIEVLRQPGPDAAAEIAGLAEDIKPKGKTPLSAAVGQAAEVPQVQRGEGDRHPDHGWSGDLQGGSLRAGRGT